MFKHRGKLVFFFMPLITLSIFLAGCGANASISVVPTAPTATVTSPTGSSASGGSSSTGSSTGHMPTALVTATASAASGVDTCLNGYVWRDAFQNDHVCVTPATRDQAAYDDSQAASRVVH